MTQTPHEPQPNETREWWEDAFDDIVQEESMYIAVGKIVDRAESIGREKGLREASIELRGFAGSLDSSVYAAESFEVFHEALDFLDRLIEGK